MAAGRQNNSFSRKRYSNETETRSYRDQFDHRSDYRRNGFEQSRFKQHSDQLQCRNRDDVKKRKFSPVVWDRVDKQVSSAESTLTNVSDGSPLVDQEAENEDGEYVVEPNLSKSKWALHDSPRRELDGNSSSPESGEFKRDGSEGNAVSSLSDENVEDEKCGDGDGKVGSDGMDYSGLESDSFCEELSVGFGVGPSCRNVFEFERLRKISEGTYGVVHQARDKKTGEIVALKKVKMGKEEGFPLTALREIKLLGELQHPYVVGLKEVVMDEFDGVYMVMEYIDHELKSYMERLDEPFGQSEVKCLMYQLLNGLSYLHDNYVIHRDLKTSNLLLNDKGELKICDFGMSRHYAEPIKPYTSLVVTLWYRAPELLLGMKHYTTAIDMWSVGCIMAELLSKKPLFDGSKELEQINKIFSTLGTPNDSRWPGYSKLPGLKSKPKLVQQPYNNLRKKFPVATFTGLGFDLLSRLLTYDPAKRITAKEALDHGWFRESPRPVEHVRICK
ncbi:Protein kinase, catalytic domain-containing protein [Artemisia annua]|uniref:cyclin-dependent kinase n=1 Tax=Artemisia annua TaxID=35608 RepID=A0A2U1MP33_ARTAN|nr:Protein kinase, catalytic domain-containing protein [Artemisia annua]